MLIYLLRERERACVHVSKGVGGTERLRERERQRENPKQVPRCQGRVWCGARSHQPRDRDLSWNWESDTQLTESPRRPPATAFEPTFFWHDSYLPSLDCSMDALKANADLMRGFWTCRLRGLLSFSSNTPYLKYFVYSTAFKDNEPFIVSCFIHRKLRNCQSRLPINTRSPVPPARGYAAARQAVARL